MPVAILQRHHSWPLSVLIELACVSCLNTRVILGLYVSAAPASLSAPRKAFAQRPYAYVRARPEHLSVHSGRMTRLQQQAWCSSCAKFAVPAPSPARSPPPARWQQLLCTPMLAWRRFWKEIFFPEMRPVWRPP
eukprot:353138-Chlamydomonas_euryale.AAC.6